MIQAPKGYKWVNIKTNQWIIVKDDNPDDDAKASS